MEHVELTPQLILQAYANGVFPMGEARDDDRIYWVAPKLRGIIPLNGFHVSRSLAKLIRKDRYQITFNRDFAGVMAGCADREETWINDTILELYCALHEMGFGQSVEVWEDGRLVGGSYGITLGGAYFGESMFSRVPSASKIALAYLVAHLRRSGYQLFDTQFLTAHLESLGGIEIPQADYRELLDQALGVRADFAAQKTPLTPQDVVQVSGQIS